MSNCWKTPWRNAVSPVPKVALGYYAHHHGSGHLRRALAIAHHLNGPLTLFSSAECPAHDLSNVEFHHLAPDTGMPLIHTEEAPSAFHYVPLGVQGITNRMAAIVDWSRSHWPCLLVVDVSVEVALFARLCAVPVIYVRQNGDRTDLPHSLAYESAVALLAPFPRALGYESHLDRWASKTVHTGFISRYSAGSMVETDSSLARCKPYTVAVLIGHGGTAITFDKLCEAANATPEWTWSVLGNVEQAVQPPEKCSPPHNLHLLGNVADPAEHLMQAEVVVGSAGDSVVAEMAHLRCRYIAVPESRPFDEQHHTATRLSEAGLALTCERWPEASAWGNLLRRASAMDSNDWNDNLLAGGAQDAACAIQTIADKIWRADGSIVPGVLP